MYCTVSQNTEIGQEKQMYCVLTQNTQIERER